MLAGSAAAPCLWTLSSTMVMVKAFPSDGKKSKLSLVNVGVRQKKTQFNVERGEDVASVFLKVSLQMLRTCKTFNDLVQ